MINEIEQNPAPVRAEKHGETEASTALSKGNEPVHSSGGGILVGEIGNPSLHVRDGRVNTRDPKEEHEDLELWHTVGLISQSGEGNKD